MAESQKSSTVAPPLRGKSAQVRLTFMRCLKDSTFTFLGIYRMSLEKSDLTRIVYERIADECDLRALDYLEQLRR